jgi:hypothetical protein
MENIRHWCRWFSSLAALAALSPLQAATDSITIREKSGVTTRNYPVQIGRPFLAGEIANFPQAVVNGTPAETQADVKLRWPDGSVKHAILAFLIPNLPARSTVTVTFRNQPACDACAPLSRMDMLDDAYNFNAQMLLMNGSTERADARTMLRNGAYSLWTSGKIAQTIILADHSNTQTCNGHPCSAYDLGFDANKSFRPIFHATFWPALHKVRVRFIGEIAQTESLEDQRYALALTVGAAEPATVYSKPVFTQYALTRWTKEFWIGGAPGEIAINHNFAYLAETRLFINYDLGKHMNADAVAQYYAGWQKAARDVGEAGNLDPHMGTAGRHWEIGPYPNYTVWWLYTMGSDNRMRQMAFGNADLAASWPVHFREGKPHKDLNRGDAPGAGTGVGHILSISNRPTLTLFKLDYGETAPADRVLPVGAMADSGWSASMGHYGDLHSPQYLLTGDFWYLEERWFFDSFAAAFPNGVATTASWGRGPTGAEGGGFDSGVRYEARPMQTREIDAAMTPDNLAEKQYFETLVEDQLAVWEGAHGLTGTKYSQAGNPEKAVYDWGDRVRAGSYRQAGGQYAAAGTISPLEFWEVGNSGLCDPTASDAAMCTSPWEEHFMMFSIGRAVELGYPAEKLRNWFCRHYTSLFTDPGADPFWLGMYRLPTVRKSTGQWFRTWEEVGSSLDPKYRALSSWELGDPATYSVIAIHAVAMCYAEPNGAAAWAAIRKGVLDANVHLSEDPQYAVAARTDGTEPVQPKGFGTSPKVAVPYNGGR